MLSLFEVDSSREVRPPQPPAPVAVSNPTVTLTHMELLAESSPASPEQPAEPVDWEFVLGRRQMASVLFVATVIVSIVSAVSYLAGKSLAPARSSLELPVQVVHAAEAAAAQATPPAPAPVPSTSPALQAPTPISEPAIFADPADGSLYLQIGSVEKGMAVLMVDGLRKNGLDAFAGPGQSTQTFRILIGPLDDSATYARAKKIVDNLELTHFARRYPH